MLLKTQQHWASTLREKAERLTPPLPSTAGTLKRMVGLTMEVVGCSSSIGERCLIESSDSNNIEAEVVGFSEDRLYLMPTGHTHGLSANAKVTPTGKVCEAAVGKELLGRVIDAAGNPLDDKGPLLADSHMPLTGRKMNPFNRSPIRDPLDVGVRAINSMLTVGRGQRIGLLAGSGVGKSVLLGMMSKYTSADITVVGLIGERSREVSEFVQSSLGKDGLARSVVIASPADNPPLMRMHGALLATSIAEYYRDQGFQVLLLMDSLTRFAQAQREIALAIGEPPATKGYPPSVFAKLPHLVERAGKNDFGNGSITAFYTVLAEGDDQNDPIVDASRAILDGHIVLSRNLADAGHYPAIDIEQSVSRVMNDITTPEHQESARKLKSLYSIYQQNKDLISVGAYQTGSDPAIDNAIAMNPGINDFLKQNIDQNVSLEQSIHDLIALNN